MIKIRRRVSGLNLYAIAQYFPDLYLAMKSVADAYRTNLNTVHEWIIAGTWQESRVCREALECT